MENFFKIVAASAGMDVQFWRYIRGGVMALRIVVAAGLSSAFLGGCASSGNESIADASHQTVSGQLVKGRTTQAQVRQLYGDPIKTSFTDSGNKAWEYEFSRLHSKPTNFIPYVDLIYSGSEGDKKSLVIFFDKSKVVSNIRSAHRKSISAEG